MCRGYECDMFLVILFVFRQCIHVVFIVCTVVNSTICYITDRCSRYIAEFALFHMLLQTDTCECSPAHAQCQMCVRE